MAGAASRGLSASCRGCSPRPGQRVVRGRLRSSAARATTTHGRGSSSLPPSLPMLQRLLNRQRELAHCESPWPNTRVCGRGCGEHREKSLPGFVLAGNGGTCCAAFLAGGFVATPPLLAGLCLLPKISCAACRSMCLEVHNAGAGLQPSVTGGARNRRGI